MGIDDETLNGLVNMAHELARGLDVYATAIDEADDQARRDLLEAKDNG